MLETVRDDVDEVLRRFGGVAERREFLRVLGRAAFDHEVRRGSLVAVFPRAYARPWDADPPAMRTRAALVSVGGDVALSHLTALAHWQLPTPPDAPLHVTAYNPRHPRGVPGQLVVHRTLLPLRPRELNGLPVVRPEVAIATSWPLLDGSAQRAPLITACRKRLVNDGMLTGVAERMTWIRGIRSFRDLVCLVLSGCESELELWGYGNVFAVPGLDDAMRQKVLRVAGKTYRVDMAYETERLAVELDGRAYHSSRDQWERDIRRDLDLATIGWQTLRLPHSRLTGDVAGCRRDVRAARAARHRHAS